MTNEETTVPVPAGRAPVFLKKAEEFLRSARRALEEGDEEAAALLSIHAAICAVDALTVRFLGRRSNSPRHGDVVRLIDRLPLESKTIVKRQLLTLLSKKNVVEYEDRLLPRGDAAEILKLADRIVESAR